MTAMPSKGGHQRGWRIAIWMLKATRRTRLSWAEAYRKLGTSYLGMTFLRKPFYLLYLLIAFFLLTEIFRRGLGTILNGPASKGRYAYITLLCDDVMAEAAMVMVLSLKQTNTPHDVLVLTMNVSVKTMQSLHTLGAKIEPITTPVPYPFMINAGRSAINKPCRYSKLLMWNLIQYEKLVYLDSDLLILKNIDELFQRPQLTAVPDTLPPDKFNSGVMVVQPSRATFKDMLAKVATTASPNVGDQGFLNSYFSDWYRQPAEHHLEYVYNGLVRLSESPLWARFIQPGLKVLHFSGSTKPWNKMVDKQFPTTRKLDHLWWAVHDDVYKLLGQSALAAAQNASSTSASLQRMLPELPAQLTPQCQPDYMVLYRGQRLARKLSVVMNCFDRFDLMRYMVARYSTMDFVHKIYVVWGNTHVEPFPESSFNSSKPVEILYSGRDSMNDRFKPILSLQTEAVLICDDDIEVNVNALQTAFQRWQDDPFRLVGFFPRSHYRSPVTGKLVYVLTPRFQFSIVLTKMFIMHADYLRKYTCTVPQELLKYIDTHKNCEDITMNFLVTQLSGLAPLLVEDPSKLDYGTTSGLSSRGTHDFSRSVCMNDIEARLSFMSLRNTSAAFAFFDRDRAVHLARGGRQVAHARLQFRPIFDAAQRSTQGRFMSQVAFSMPAAHSTIDVAEIPSDANQGVVLCIKGDNDDDPEDSTSNVYTLLEYASVPSDAVHLSGTTFVLHSEVGFEGRIVLMRQLAGLLAWRESHGCFGPARVVFMHDAVFQAKLSPWTAAVMKAVLGPAAVAYKPADPALPECMEAALVVRQRDTWSDECISAMQDMRKAVHAFCRHMPIQQLGVPVLDDKDANVRVAFVGDASSWQHVEWFNYSYLASILQQECTDLGLSCQIAMVPRGEFCRVKVLGLSRADLVIGPWGDRAMDNVVFLKPATAVLEITPPLLSEEESDQAKRDLQCLGLNYDQQSWELGLNPMLAWTFKQLEDLGRRGRQVPLEAPCFLETCVVRNLKY